MTASRGYLGARWPWLLALSLLVAVVALVLALTVPDDSDPDQVSFAEAPSDDSDVADVEEQPEADTASSADEAADQSAADAAGGAEPAPSEESDSAGHATAAEADTSSVVPEAPSDSGTPTADASVDEAESERGPPAEPDLRVDPAQIRQGETVLVRLSGVDAGSAWLTVDGATTVMVDEAGVWVGFVPVQPLSELGAYTVIIDLFDDQGDYADTVLGEFRVVDAEVRIESITLIPGDEGLLAPALVAQDNTVRFVDHTGISGPRAWREPWISPLGGPATGIFGALRSYNGAAASDWHHGHDISAPEGAAVSAPAPGTVVFAGSCRCMAWG